MFDQYGYLYILDDGNMRVQKWLPGGTFGTTVLAGTFTDPVGMRIDPIGNLFIADSGYHRVQSFTLVCRKSLSRKDFLLKKNLFFLLILFSTNKYINNSTTK